MALNFGSNEVNNVLFNGQTVERVIYNSTLVWEAKTPEEKLAEHYQYYIDRDHTMIGLDVSTSWFKRYANDSSFDDATVNWAFLALLDVSEVRDMKYCLAGSSLTTAEHIKDWDISKVENTSYMFRSCTKLASLTGLNNWDSSIGTTTTMEYMFAYCSAITDFEPIHSWRTIANKSLMGTFAYCTGMTNLDWLRSWSNTSNVTTHNSTFQNCTNLVDASGYSNLSQTNNTSISYTFSGCTKLERVEIGSSLNYSKLSSTSSTFTGCGNLRDVVFNGDIVIKSTSFIDSANLRKTHLFIDDTEYTYLRFNSTYSRYRLRRRSTVMPKSIDATTKALVLHYQAQIDSTNEMGGSSYTTDFFTRYAGGSGFNKENVNWIFLKYLDTAKVTTFKYLLSGTNLTNTDYMEHWDVSNVTSFLSMFARSKMQYIRNLSTWDTSKVTTLYGLCYYAYDVTNISGLKNWDTSSVTSMAYLFNGCAITDFSPIKWWDVRKVASISYAFRANPCQVLDLHMWELPSAVTVSYTFYNMSKLQYLAFHPGGSYTYSSTLNNTTALQKIYISDLPNTYKGLSGWSTYSSKIYAWNDLYQRSTYVSGTSNSYPHGYDERTGKWWYSYQTSLQSSSIGYPNRVISPPNRNYDLKSISHSAGSPTATLYYRTTTSSKSCTGYIRAMDADPFKLVVTTATIGCSGVSSEFGMSEDFSGTFIYPGKATCTIPGSNSNPNPRVTSSTCPNNMSYNTTTRVVTVNFDSNYSSRTEYFTITYDTQ